MAELFLEWYFLELPAKIKKIWGNYLWFFSEYFAIGDLLSEFFAPWKGLVFAREKRGFDMGDIFSTWIGNLISRMVGMFVRFFFLVVGIAVELLAFAGGIVVFIAWAVVFVLMPASLVFGFWLLIS